MSKNKKKSKVVMVDGIPIKPISAAERGRLDRRIKRKHEELRKRDREVHGKKVDWISHWIEEGILFSTVRFMDGKCFSVTYSPCVILDTVDFPRYVHGRRRNPQRVLPKERPLMGEWKICVTLRMRGDLRTEMIAFAEQEKRSLGSLAAILLEWSFEHLKAAGSTTKLFVGAKRETVELFTRDRRLKDG